MPAAHVRCNRMLTAIGAMPQLEVLLLAQGNYSFVSTFSPRAGTATDEGLLQLVARGAQSQLRSLTLKNLGSVNGQELLRAACGACPLLTSVSITGTNVPKLTEHQLQQQQQQQQQQQLPQPQQQLPPQQQQQLQLPQQQQQMHSSSSSSAGGNKPDSD
jgi:hypothetical protein